MEFLNLFRVNCWANLIINGDFRPIGHFAGYDVPAVPINTGIAGISTFWEEKFTFENDLYAWFYRTHLYKIVLLFFSWMSVCIYFRCCVIMKVGDKIPEIFGVD